MFVDRDVLLNDACDGFDDNGGVGKVGVPAGALSDTNGLEIPATVGD